MPTPRRPLVLLLVLALCTAVLAACGGSNGAGSASGKNVSQLLGDTFGGDAGVKSGRVQAALDVALQGIASFSKPLVVELDGPFQSMGKGKIPKFDLSVSLKQAGQGFSAGIVSTGDKGYLKLGGKAYDVGAQLYGQISKSYADAQKKAGTKGPTTLKAIGIDPSHWLKDPRKAGEADVEGTKTVHITAGIDVPRLLDDVNKLLAGAGSLGVTAGTPVSSLTTQQKRDIARSVKSAVVDIYTGADDTILRKLTLKVILDVPADARRSVGGMSSGTISLNLVIADVNKDQTIKTPAGAKPIAELLGGVGGLFGGGSAAPSGGAGSAASKAYLDCIQASGQDVAKLQKCAALLH